MRNFIKKGCICFILLFGLILFTGCSKENGDDSQEAVAHGVSEEVQAQNETKLIKDMAGREVEIPVNIKKVYCTSPVGTIITYTVLPDLLAGLNYEASNLEKEYLLPSFSRLPVLGGWYGKGNEGNLEEIAKAKPDIILNAGAITDDTVEFSDNLQKQLGIPVVFAGVDLLTMADSYHFLGDLLGMKERTDELAAYVTEALQDAQDKVADVKEVEKIRVYYAEDAHGLQTDPAGSSHTQILDLLAGINVADVEVTSGYGRAEVSVEQVIAWDPDLIISGFDVGTADGESAYDYMQTDPVLMNLRAIQNGNIYEVPYAPFSWFDRPPSANMILGIKWTAQILYPDLFDYDMREEAKRFYKLFYYCDLTDEQVNTLLSRSSR
jgi:iron complex transport system substrate-binding protein